MPAEHSLRNHGGFKWAGRVNQGGRAPRRRTWKKAGWGQEKGVGRPGPAGDTGSSLTKAEEPTEPGDGGRGVSGAPALPPAQGDGAAQAGARERPAKGSTSSTETSSANDREHCG